MENLPNSSIENVDSIKKTVSYTFKQPFHIIIEYMSNLNILENIKQKSIINEFKIISGNSNLLLLEPISFYFSLKDLFDWCRQYFFLWKYLSNFIVNNKENKWNCSEK